ncbi:MATE family efflux transporter [Chloroflexota bacterium]
MQEAALKRDWTKGSIIGNLLLLSWPILILNSLYGVSLTLEMIWVGRLGAVSIAGLGIASVVDTLATMMASGVTIGTRAMVARFIGAGDVDSANHVVAQSFVLSVAFGVIMAAIGAFLAEPILRLFGVDTDVVTEGVLYLRIMLVGWVSMAFWHIVFASMQASGDSVTPLKLATFIRSVHAVLCPFLVLGWWVFPRLGVSGAATANIIYQSLGGAIGLWLLSSGRTRLRLTRGDFRITLNTIWRILKIGIPASVMNTQRAFSNLFLAWLMVPFGTLAVAAHSLVSRVERWVYMTAGGLGIGAGVLVGQNLGAGLPERAERGGWLAAVFAEGIVVFCSVAVLLWAENIIGIFSTDPALMELASVFLRIAAANFLAMAIVRVMQHCISGAGDTLPVMLVSLVMLWAVLLPLAFLLPQVTNLGMYGVRWAIVISMFVGAVAYTIYFRLGGWKRKQV